MIEFCEVVHSESYTTRVISVDACVKFFTYLSNSMEDDDDYTDAIEKTKTVIEDSLQLDEDDLETGLSDEEARATFDQELQRKVVFQSYRFEGGEQSFQEQFLSWFRVFDMGDTGCVGRKDFEHVMRNKIGVYFPTTRPILIQVFNSMRDDDGNVSYQTIGEEVVAPIDQKIQEFQDAFTARREEERAEEQVVTLIDVDQVVEMMEGAFENLADPDTYHEGPFDENSNPKERPDYDQEGLVHCIRKEMKDTDMGEGTFGPWEYHF